MSRADRHRERVWGLARSTRGSSKTRLSPAAAIASSGALDLPLEELLDFDLDELLEFLDADGADVAADPVFKERLRLELWWLIATRSAEQRRSRS